MIPYRHMSLLEAALGRSPSWFLYGADGNGEQDLRELLLEIKAQLDAIQASLERP